MLRAFHDPNVILEKTAKAVYSNTKKDEDKFYRELCKPQMILRVGISLNFASLSVGTQGSTCLVLLEVWPDGREGRDQLLPGVCSLTGVLKV